MTKKPKRTAVKKPGKASGKKKVSSAKRQSSASQKTKTQSRRAGPIAPVSKDDGLTEMLDRIVGILEQARDSVVRAVNSEMVLAYWHIGREIVEHLQSGSDRASYGEQLIEALSAQLQERVGKGYSATNLKYFRQFYQVYADREPRIRHEARDQLPVKQEKRHQARDVSVALSLATSPGSLLEGFSNRLSWTHYRTLSKVSHPAERAFYEIEAEREGWSVPHLERQIHTQLFARLLKSRDKAGVMDLATRGQVLERPIDAMKHPYVLDFLDLPESHQLRERDLETAILDKLQQFLLELGKGFAFIARQKRMSFEDEYFFVDLVFYNVILKCYLLVDLKLGKLTHQDVGQMDSYVRLFDDQCRGSDDNPTIGLILCAEKDRQLSFDTNHLLI